MTPRQLLGRNATGRFVRTHRVTEAFGCLFSGTRSPCKSAGTQFWHPTWRQRGSTNSPSPSTARLRAPAEVAGEARVITFVDTLAWASPVQETQGPCLRAFLIWAGQGSNLRPWV